VRIISRSFLWREGRGAAVAVRILVPEVAGVVAGAADVQRVGEGAQLAGRVEHQRHLSPTCLRDVQHVLGLLARIAVVPAVDLEGAVADLAALLGEVAKASLLSARRCGRRDRSRRRPAGACGSRRAAR
jgi:hypothetical protein